MARLLVIGGTGFLGYYTILDALKKGFKEEDIGTISYKDIDLEGWFPKGIKVDYMDVFTCTEDELVPLMKGYDYMVYSVGPDDRYTPPKPSYKFFHDRLVIACAKVFRAAERAGIKKSVVYNSYFTYFNDIYPKLKLVKYHPYVRCRVEQAKLLNEQKKNMQVVVLELPYIFGSMPKRTPLWRGVFLDRYLNGHKVIFFPKGTTTMIHVKHIGEAGMGALLYGKDGAYYPIGDQNKSYNFMLDEMMKDLIGHTRKIVNPAGFLCAFGAWFIVANDKLHGHEPGLNYTKVMSQIMSKDIVIPEDVMDSVNAELHITRGDLEEGIKDTIEACYPDKKEFK